MLSSELAHRFHWFPISIFPIAIIGNWPHGSARLRGSYATDFASAPPLEKVAAKSRQSIDRVGSRTRLSTSHNPSISLCGFFPTRLLTCDRKPATSMALLTRGLEVLGQPKAPPLSKESTWWLDQCRCWKFQSFLITLSERERKRDRRRW